VNQIKIRGYRKRSSGPVAGRGYYIHLGDMRWVRVPNEREAKAKLVELSKELDRTFKELMACYRIIWADGMRHLYYMPDASRVQVLSLAESVNHHINYLIRSFAQGAARENAFCVRALRKFLKALTQMVDEFEKANRIDHTGIHEPFAMVRLQLDRIKEFLSFEEYVIEKERKNVS